MDFVESIDSKKLENLAISFADVVLRINKRQSISKVNLYGREQEILVRLGKSMEQHFKERKADISVGYGSAGYSIDVGYLMRR